MEIGRGDCKEHFKKIKSIDQFSWEKCLKFTEDFIEGLAVKPRMLDDIFLVRWVPILAWQVCK